MFLQFGIVLIQSWIYKKEDKMLNKWGRKLQQHYKERWTFMTKTKVLNVHGAIVGLEKVVPIG